MAIRTELGVRLPNSPGALAEVCERLGRERVHILAMSIEPGVGARLLVDNPLSASEVLRAAHVNVVERDVLYATVSDDPGALGRLLRGIANAGVNIEYAYGSSVDGGRGIGVV